MDDFKHSVPLLGGGQANFQQCWYASYGMLLKFHNRSAGEVDGKLSSAGIDVADAKANGLVDKDYKRAADSLGLKTWSGAPFKKAQGFFDVGLSDGAEAFINELKVSPLWVSRFIEKGSYHITLAVGYKDEGKGYIIYNNPYPGPNNALEQFKFPANIFVRDITDAMGSVQAVR
ncbi:MAG: hypothetical protein LH614_02530 [Pyrinomonadaceae bacterium]|nr:hypothetical protein [Pyrinomonadaceae bacterium]